MFELQREAGNALPVVKSDPELRRFPGVVVDFDEMKKKNAVMAVKLASMNLSKDI